MPSYIYNATTKELENVAGGTLFADMPIGTIVPFGGSVIPDDYKLCDGSELLKTEYADLYAVIGDAFGTASENTKFVIPDLRGEFIRGAGTNSHSGQGDGGSVGTHQDATRQMGSYEGASDMITLKPLDGDKKTDPNTCDKIISTTQHAWYYHTAYVNVQSDLVLQYTARPTNTSVNFIIKALKTALPADFESQIEDVVDTALEPITDVIPSTASSSNKLATKADIAKCISDTDWNTIETII